MSTQDCLKLWAVLTAFIIGCALMLRVMVETLASVVAILVS